MSDSPRARPSRPRSHTEGVLVEKGRENLPLLTEGSLSQHKPRYTSGKKVPITPTPSHLPSTDADHGTAPTPLAGDPAVYPGTTNETQKSPSVLANPQEETSVSRSRSRLVALYHGYNPQMILENRGSTARDHLASERTFLAYVRTSLATASAGVALVQLFTSSATKTPGIDASKRIQKFARPLGVSTVVMALIILGIAAYRYFLIQVALPRNTFPVARFSVIFITFSLSAVVIVIFALLAGR